MALPIEFWYYVGFGVFSMTVVVGIMSFLLGGFLGPFMKVKRSRGKKLLVRVRNPIHDYFRAGTIEEGYLCFKDREKNDRRIPMQHGVVSRAATVYWIEVDDEKNCFFKRDTAEAIPTMDAVKNDSLYKRAMYKPGILGQDTMKWVLVLVILNLLVSIIIGVMIYKQSKNIGALMSLVQVNTQTGVV